MERCEKMLYDLLKTRRSIRKYLDKAVDKEMLDKILKSGLLAPSSRSRRPWSFIVVTEKNSLEKLAECRGQSSRFLAGAPVGIVVIADPEVSDVWIEDTSIASVLMQLAAHDLGLGSCWIQIRERMHSQEIKAEDYVKEVLGIPENYHVESILALGYPDELKPPYEEDGLCLDKIYYHQFGQQ